MKKNIVAVIWKMKKSTLTAWCLSIALGLFAIILLVCWILYLIFHEGPKSIAVRKDAQGMVTQEIVCETKSDSEFHLIGPHGPPGLMKGESFKYFLQAPGKPRRELTFLKLGDSGRWWCWPVDNSSLWVSCDKEHDTYVVVFDDNHVLHERRLKTKPKANGEWKMGTDYWFENGNRVLVYRSKQGFDAYDVATDSISEWKQKKK